MKRNLQHNYDHKYDVLYISTIPNEPAISREETEGIVIRRSRNTGSFVGITIFDFKRRYENDDLPKVNEYIDYEFLTDIVKNELN